MDADLAPMQEYYALGAEHDRLAADLGAVEFLRTCEIVLRHLPPAPATIADIGGGPGRYAVWLAERGYAVRHRDLVALHVEQLRERSAATGRVETALGDARGLDLGDSSVDAVLLLGPLYHLDRGTDREQALREARRILRPGGVIFVAAISRWAPRLHGMLVQELWQVHPQAYDVIETVEADGVLPPLFPQSFCGYTHRPEQLRRELAAAGLDVVDLVGVEGAAFALSDLADRLADPVRRAMVLDTARAVERVPELLGLSPHLLATARRLG